MPVTRTVPDLEPGDHLTRPTGPTGGTLRAFSLGALLCVLVGIGPIYANCIIKGPFMAWAFSTPAALFLLFYLVLGNILIGALHRSLALSLRLLRAAS